MTFLDTNILIYASIPDHEYYKRVIKIFEEKENLYISNQVVLEYIQVMTSKKFFDNPLIIKEALKNIDTFLLLVKLVKDHNINFQDIKNNLENLPTVNMHNLNIYLTMKLNNISNIVTFNDKDFKIFNDIKVTFF